MNFYLIGINYNSAPLEIREVVYGKRGEISDFWIKQKGPQVEILATCNRFEIYLMGNDFSQGCGRIDAFHSQFSEFLDYGYLRYGQKEVSRHLLRLCVGLESQIKGELQIQQQLNLWLSQKNFSLRLAGLLRDIITESNDIRKLSGLNCVENNIARLIYDDIAVSFSKENILEITVAGTGKIAELFALYRPKNSRLTFAAHKNFSKAEKLARQSSGEAVSFDKLDEKLIKADILVSATSSPHIIFDQDYLRKITSLRKESLRAYDLAAPRDIDPRARRVNGLILKNTDDLAGVFEEHNLKLEQNIKLAEYLVEESIEYYERPVNAKTSESWHKA